MLTSFTILNKIKCTFKTFKKQNIKKQSQQIRNRTQENSRIKTSKQKQTYFNTSICQYLNSVGISINLIHVHVIRKNNIIITDTTSYNLSLFDQSYLIY